jgi:hypothetical protein
MQLPEITIANQSFRKVGFLNASHVEVFLEVFSMGTDGSVFSSYTKLIFGSWRVIGAVQRSLSRPNCLKSGALGARRAVGGAE